MPTPPSNDPSIRPPAAAPGVRRQGGAIACTADAPRVQTRVTKGGALAAGWGEGGGRRGAKHGGALGATNNPIWIATADRGRLINKVR